MDFRTTYGTLLKEQLESYARTFELLDKIAEYESPKASHSNSTVYTQSRTTLQTERLTMQLDKTFKSACQSMERIEQMSFLYQQILNHPVYMQLLEIHIMAEAKVNETKLRYSATR